MNDVDKNAEMEILDLETNANPGKEAAIGDGSKALALQSIEDQVRLAVPKMKPTIAEKFDQVDGACEYFFILERENEKVVDQI